MSLVGLASYLVFFLTLAGIYALMAQGLNVQWGYAGMLNVGVAAFFAIGAYTSAILTTGASDGHLGGFGLPWPLAKVVHQVLGAAIAEFERREGPIAVPRSVEQQLEKSLGKPGEAPKPV